MESPSPAVRKHCVERGFSPNVSNGGFAYLLRSWKQTVDEIEDGYYALFDEYVNDMDGRRIISDLLPLACMKEKAEVEEVLPPLDLRFFNATHPVDACILGEDIAAKRSYRQDLDWWYYRTPIDLSKVPDRDRWL